MRFAFKIRLLLYKRYFDTGIGLTNYIKYLIGFFAIASLNVASTLIIAVFYGIFCYFLGWWYIKHKWFEADMEISNIFNPFVSQVRKKFRISANRKV